MAVHLGVYNVGITACGKALEIDLGATYEPEISLYKTRADKMLQVTGNKELVDCRHCNGMASKARNRRPALPKITKAEPSMALRMTKTDAWFLAELLHKNGHAAARGDLYHRLNQHSQGILG